MNPSAHPVSLEAMEALLSPGELLWLLGPDLACLYMGQRAGELLGAEAASFSGRPAERMFSAEALSLLRGALANPAQAQTVPDLGFTAGPGLEISLETRLAAFSAPDGTPRLLGLSRLAPISPARTGLTQVLDALQSPVFLLDREGLVNRANQAAASWLGLPRERLLGARLSELAPEIILAPQALELLAAAANRALGPEGGCEEQSFLGQGENARYLRIMAQPLADAPGGPLALVSLSDLTGQRRMEELISQLSTRLEETVDRRTDRLSEENLSLARLDRMRRDLTAMVVHDMKSPLAEVMGNLSVLARRLVRRDDVETLELAQSGAQDLQRMIMNLLDIERMEEGRLTVRASVFPFREAAREALGKFTGLTRLTDMTTEIEGPQDLEILADPDLLARVLMNLLSNAFNHTPEGGRITLSAREAEGQPAGRVISLVDNGEGIAPDKLARIWDRFTQGHEGRAKGTGLGLTFCHMAVAAHGGRIWAESRPGEGGAFHIWLPWGGQNGPQQS